MQQKSFSLNLNLQPGEVLYIRGPNGVGKTTFLLGLAGVFGSSTAFFNTTLVLGSKVYRNGMALPASFLGSESVLRPEWGLLRNLLYWNLLDKTGLNFVQFGLQWSQLKLGFHFSDQKALVEGVLNYVGLTDLQNKKVAHLSTGQLKRAHVARLLLCPRPLWLLDEPFNGLDRQGKHLVKALLEWHLSLGGCAIIALHDHLDSFSGKVLHLYR